LHEHMAGSVFCPAPPGDTQLATRQYDAILAGCIPVVLTDGPVPLPFDNVLNWSDFAVLLPTASLYDGSFVRTLRSMPFDRIEELRRMVYKVRPYFMVTSSCESPSGVDIFMHQLALQKKNDPILNGTTLRVNGTEEKERSPKWVQQLETRLKERSLRFQVPLSP